MSSGSIADAAPAPNGDGAGNDAADMANQAFADASISSGASPTESAQPLHRPCSDPDATKPHVTVSDPVQHNEGIKGKFTMYRVAYDPPPAATGGGRSPGALFPYATAVDRRYSDFAWLFDHLHKERPGAIVPPLPDKQPWQQSSRLSEDFVEERRLHLEVFLRRVVCSPELVATECLLVFLGGGEEEFKKAKKGFGKAGVPGSPRSAHQAREDDYINDGVDQQDTLMENVKEQKNGIKKWIKERKTTMKGTLVRSPDDAVWEEVTNFILALEAGLKRIEAQASAMVKREKEASASFLELGLGCDALTHLDDYGRGDAPGDGAGDEAGDSGVCRAFRLVGRAADAVAARGADHSRRGAARLVAPLRDHLKMVHAVKVALSKRNNRRVTYSTCLNAVDAKKASWHKSRITPGQEGRAPGIESSLSRAEQAVVVARANYEEVSVRMLREVDRFRRESATAMYATIRDFARAQKEHAESVNAAWGALLTEVEGVDATASTWDSFSQMAAAVKDGGNDKSGTVAMEGGTTTLPSTEENAPMPSDPPPPEPSTSAACDTMAESSVLAGAVRYRDPLPEE